MAETTTEPTAMPAPLGGQPGHEMGDAPTEKTKQTKADANTAAREWIVARRKEVEKAQASIPELVTGPTGFCRNVSLYLLDHYQDALNDIDAGRLK